MAVCLIENDINALNSRTKSPWIIKAISYPILTARLIRREGSQCRFTSDYAFLELVGRADQPRNRDNFLTAESNSSEIFRNRSLHPCPTGDEGLMRCPKSPPDGKFAIHPTDASLELPRGRVFLNFLLSTRSGIDIVIASLN